MSWRKIITKNMLRNLQRYLGYLLAATLAVTVFAMFTAFVDNPAVQDGHIARTASELLIVFRVIVALFAIFFIFYFHAALIRSRNKEFGLFLTLGVTPRQIGRAIFYESVLMGLVALGVGIGLGILCSFFFLLIMETILGIPDAIPFMVPLATVTTTSTFFGVVFLLEACWVSLRVTRRTPRVLLLGARARQNPPSASWLLVLLGLVCVGLAYDLALQFSFAILLTMIPIIALTIIGTYFLLSQGSVLLLTHLRRPGIPGTRLLIVSRLAYRMRDYARMLTVVTVLNAVVLTGLGAVFGALNLVQTQTTRLEPFSLQLAVNTLHPPALTPAQIQQEIASQHFDLQAVVTTSLLVGTASAEGIPQPLPVSIMSLSSFVHLQEVERQAHPEIAQNQSNVTTLSDNQAHILTPYPENIPPLQNMQLTVGTRTLALHVDVGNTRVINMWHGITYAGPPEEIVVVNATHYEQLAQSAAPADSWRISSYELSNWQQNTPLVNILRQHLSADQQSLLTDTVTANADVEQLLSVMLFADFFLSCLFFLAAGSAIYFKLFNQQEDDRRQFHALERIGMQSREIGGILNCEFLLLFFFPVLLGIIHSTIALLDLSHLFKDNDAASAIGQAFALVCLIYIVCFALYFWVSRVSYLNRMQLAKI